jgi:hypothetical protein
VYSTYSGFNCAASVPSSSFDEGAKSSPEGRDSWPGWLHADEATDGTLWHRDPRPETLPDDKAGSVDLDANQADLWCFKLSIIGTCEGWSVGKQCTREAFAD